MRKRLLDIRKSATYVGLVAWRTRGLWLRAFLCFLIGALILFLDESENYDLRFTIRGPQTPDPRIVIVDIPERDWTLLQDNVRRNMIRPLKEIVNYSDSFFWHPAIWQNLLTILLEQEPAAVGIGLYFGDTVRISQLTNEQKNLFLDPRLVWGADLDTNGRVLVPELAATYNAKTGLKHLRPDNDGLVRRFSSSLLQIPGLPLRVAEVAVASTARLPEIDQMTNGSTNELRLAYQTLKTRVFLEQRRLQETWENQQRLINFRGPTETYVTLNIRDILERRVPLEILRGKIVLIGSHASPVDQMLTPLGRMSRAEVLANVTDNILGDRWIRRAPTFIYLIMLAGLLIFALWILTNYPQTVALLLFLWTGTLLAALSAWTFDSYYIWLPVLSPLILLGFTYIVFLSYQLTLNEQKTWRLEQERQNLMEIERLKNNFVSMMSHDLKTPIAKIQGIVDRLMLHADEALTHDLKSLRRSSNDLHRYIQSILQVTRVEAKDFKISKEVIDINEQIEKVVGRLASLAHEKQIQLIVTLEPMFSIEADTTLIQEVILNLIENAIKYTPAGGKISIISQEKDDNVYVIVEDTGVGIPPEDQEAVWGKFTRGSQVHLESKGTGLGLYLVKYFIELHGGRVFLESLPSIGTKIGFAIPVATDQGASA